MQPYPMKMERVSSTSNPRHRDLDSSVRGQRVDTTRGKEVLGIASAAKDLQECRSTGWDEREPVHVEMAIVLTVELVGVELLPEGTNTHNTEGEIQGIINTSWKWQTGLLNFLCGSTNVQTSQSDLQLEWGQGGGGEIPAPCCAHPSGLL